MSTHDSLSDLNFGLLNRSSVRVSAEEIDRIKSIPLDWSGIPFRVLGGRVMGIEATLLVKTRPRQPET